MHIEKLALLLACALMCGCSSLPGSITTRVDSSESRADRLLKNVGRADPGKSAPSTVVHENGIWIAKNSIPLTAKDNLPPVFNEPATFDRTVYSLSEFAERITLRSGIPTKITPDALSAASRALQGGEGAAGTAAKPAGASGAPAPAGASGSAGVATRIIYPQGTLRGLLDTAAARFGVYWKYVNGSIQLFYTDTRTFQISAIPGDSALTATVASGSISGGSSGAGSSSGGSSGSSASGNSGVSSNNSQNTALRSTLSVYASIEKSVGAMLSPFGQVVASPSTGAITVTDTPDKLDRIALFIEGENKSLSRQVMINVTVLGVTLSSGDNLGINWNLIYDNLSRKYGIANNATSTTSGNSFSAAIVNATSNLKGSSLIVDALAEQGRVRRETTASVVTLNNQPVPVQVAKQTTYLASSQTTLTANVGSSITLTPGMVTSGFNMTILPHILNNGTVMLQFSADISSLRQLRIVSSPLNYIESPELDTRNFMQRVAMKSNETLVLSGFEQTDDNLNQKGTGHPANFLFGGGHTATSSKEVIVILITPVTMGNAKAEQ